MLLCYHGIEEVDRTRVATDPWLMRAMAGNVHWARGETAECVVRVVRTILCGSCAEGRSIEYTHKGYLSPNSMRLSGRMVRAREKIVCIFMPGTGGSTDTA